MEEVKVFARLLAPKYGITGHYSLTANSKVFETTTAEDQKIVFLDRLTQTKWSFQSHHKAVGILWNALFVRTLQQVSLW